MLTDEELARYHDDGFIIPDYRLSNTTLAKIRSMHSQFIERYSVFSDYCPALLPLEPGFLEIAQDEIILDMVGQILGENFALWNSSFFAKPALNGHATPWHQDGQYWPIKPLATCTVWLAIDDATIENGCLRFIKGSHIDQRLKSHNLNEDKNLTLNQELNKEEFNEDEAVNLILKRGQISLHDVYLVHGSEANKSSKSRRAITMRFMPTTSFFDHQMVKEKKMFSKLNASKYSDRKIYHMRGKDVSNKNNLTYV